MSGIRSLVMEKVRSELQLALIDNISIDDPTIVGVVKVGDLQGEPDPDVARISVTLYYNDPDQAIGGAVTGLSGAWDDYADKELQEIGGVATYHRRFSLKLRGLFEITGETHDKADEYLNTVRARIENILPRISFSGLVDEAGEYVSCRVLNVSHADVLQSGGPPDSYDYLGKYRFEVLTTTRPVGYV